MKCYDFELNISAYIEGELKLVVRQSFNEHMKNCTLCEEKFADISKLMDKMQKLTPLVTSSKFIHNLNKKIQGIDNRGPTVLERLLQFRPLGFDPVHALGFSMAIFMIIAASYLLINRDGLPEINMERLSSRSQKQTTKPFQPSVVIPPHNGPSIADSDTSVKPDLRNRFNEKIHLTGGN